MKTMFEAFVAILFVVMWGRVEIVDAFVLLPQVTIQLNRRRTSPVSKSLSMSSPAREEGNLLKFGSRIPMNVALPTRDVDKAKSFLSKTEYIVESTWMKGKQTNMGKGVFMLQFLTLPIGFDNITPEIEVEFLYDPENYCIRMKSGKWQLIGKEGVKKDSRFMNSFQIYLEGVLKIVPSPSSSNINNAVLTDGNGGMVSGKEGELQNLSSSQVMVDGWVRYAVEGEKPNIFKRAPQFILDNTIAFIQSNVERFAYKEFAGRLLKAFVQYSAQQPSTLLLPASASSSSSAVMTSSSAATMSTASAVLQSVSSSSDSSSVISSSTPVLTNVASSNNDNSNSNNKVIDNRRPVNPNHNQPRNANINLRERIIAAPPPPRTSVSNNNNNNNNNIKAR